MFFIVNWCRRAQPSVDRVISRQVSLAEQPKGSKQVSSFPSWSQRQWWYPITCVVVLVRSDSMLSGIWTHGQLAALFGECHRICRKWVFPGGGLTLRWCWGLISIFPLSLSLCLLQVLEDGSSHLPALAAPCHVSSFYKLLWPWCFITATQNWLIQSVIQINSVFLKIGLVSVFILGMENKLGWQARWYQCKSVILTSKVRRDEIFWNQIRVIMAQKPRFRLLQIPFLMLQEFHELFTPIEQVKS